eukprot:CAMPEP_0203899804 /NCGR_PEP_ID=MMETSP0359-20131031/42153_1 /ASSEMBLY_ACC=CAM_ASM_000338 /TAXON_ID=268821 /ORGANISM="Scrippsiella Hangoei, Strain SHTV-5" /LENGTH=1320 /DNA_ID=CAMNT_0050823127 /DNA_START=104 /DNA_END=4066 /DNA_ORIENTATION=-
MTQPVVVVSAATDAAEAAKPAGHRCDEEHPWTSARFASRQLVLWIWPLLSDGFKRPLQRQDVWPLPSSMGADYLSPRFEAALLASGGALRPALWRLVRRRVALLWMGHYAVQAVMISSPVLIVAMIRFLSNPDAPVWHGLLIALGGFAFANANAAGSAFIHRNAIGKGCELRLQTMLALFQKAMRLRTWGCSEGLVSGLIASMSVDCERIYFMMHMGSWINFQMSLFVVINVMLWLQVGILAGTAGALILMVLMVCTAKVGSTLMLYRRRSQVQSAQRLLLTRQAVDGIRAIKMYGWVEPIESRIAASRTAEEGELKWYLMLRALSTTIAFIVPTAVTFTILVVASLGGQTPSVEGVFVVYSLVNILRGPMSGFPIVVGYMTDGLVSVQRVAAMLALPEAPPEAAEWNASKRPSEAAAGSLVVDLKGASFSWTAGPAVAPLQEAGPADDGRQPGDLRGLNLRIGLGELCCVVGPVGAGKSSLVSAVLGHMSHVAGSRVLNSPSGVAYCAQEPWILSAEIWQNIAAGCLQRSDVDASAYERALQAAQLAADLALFPAGDATEIGAHGINLSGGQRARVALARAIYQCEVGGSELVVLDDVLSAVDLGVARALMSQCIMGEALRTSARLVVLNSHYELLDCADRIVVVAEGRAEVYEGVAAYKSSPWAASLEKAQQEGRSAESVNSAAATKNEVPEWIAAGLADFEVAAAAEAVDASGQLLVPEDRKVGLLSFSTYRLYFGRGSCGCGSALFLAVLMLILATEAMRIYCDLYIVDWASAPTDENGEAEGGNKLWITRYAQLSAAMAVMCLVRSVIFMMFARRASKSMHQRMLAHALRAPTNLYFDTVPTAQILNRLGKDLDVVDTMLPHYLLEFFQDWGFLFGTFVVVAWKATPVLIAVPFCAVAFVRIRACYMASSRELKRLEAVSRSPLLATLSEALEGLTSIRAMRLKRSFEHRFTKQAEENGTLFWHSFVLLPWMINLVDGVGSIFVLATALSLVFLRSNSTPLAGGLAFSFIINWTGKLQWAVRQSIEAENYLTSVERCEHFERIPQEFEPDDQDSQATLAFAEAAQRSDVPAIEFRNVSVRYRPRLPLVINDLSFSVHAGERVGIIGRTGCGKSTLTLCLFRLLEVEPTGEVRIYGCNVRSLSSTVLRRAIAAVPQSPLVFAGSLRENMDPLALLEDDALWRALEQVGLGAFVRQGAGGLDMAVAEGGANMSAGQRQLLTIARASLRRARLVVCDEATSSCDPRTDATVQRLLQGRTSTEGVDGPFAGAAMLTIAHRLDTLATYDRVLLLSPPSGGAGTGVREIVRPPTSEKMYSL